MVFTTRLNIGMQPELTHGNGPVDRAFVDGGDSDRARVGQQRVHNASGEQFGHKRPPYRG
ncbi:hypothetical protein [Subtercola lobariae]|uniref:hypothetical protein n=1 Tax=Subtercola lobariae TaxID=1588641 RepID=UPI00357152EC